MNTLYDYYKSIGQNLPSVADRQGVATKAGITSGYSGTADQNATVLNYLKSQNANSNTPGTNNNINIPPTPPKDTPPAKTLESAYKSVGPVSGLIDANEASLYDKVITSKQNTVDTPIDETAIRKSFRERIQGQIDAINNMYASMIGNAKIKGQDALGMGRAVNARSGLLGSDFATSDEKRINTANQEVLDAYEAEKTAKIQALESDTDFKASQQFQTLKSEKEKAQTDLLSTITSRATSRTSNAGKIAQYLISKGLTSMSQLSPEDQKQIQTEYGVDPATLTTAFTTAYTAYQKDQDTADKDRYKTIADGAFLYDSKTGKIIENEKSMATPFGGSFGGGSTTINGSTSTYHPVVNTTLSLMGLSGDMATSSAINEVGAEKFVNAVIKQEGGSPQGVKNNPGNIKFANLPGQVNSGVRATDGGTFASYSSPEAGKQAVLDWFVQRGNNSLTYNIARYKGVSNPASGGTGGTYSNEAMSYINSYRNGKMTRKEILDSIPSTDKFASFKASVVSGMDEIDNGSVATENKNASMKTMDDTISALEKDIDLVGTWTLRQQDSAIPLPYVNLSANKYSTYLNNVKKVQQQLLQLSGPQLKAIFGPQISNADADTIKEIVSNALDPKNQTKEDSQTSLNDIKRGLEIVKNQYSYQAPAGDTPDLGNLRQKYQY